MRVAETARWARAESSAGRQPPRALNERSLDDVAAEVGELLGVAEAVSGLPAREFLAADGAHAVDELLVDGAVRLVDRAGRCRVGPGDTGPLVCRYAFSRQKPRLDIAAAAHLAAVVVATDDPRWELVSVARSERSGGPPSGRRWRTVGRDPIGAARRLLDVLAGFYLTALSHAVPLFERTSQQLHAGRFLDESLLGPTAYGTGDLDDTDVAFVWADVPLADLLAMSPSPLEVADRLWGAVGQFTSMTESTATTVRRTRAGGAR
jgi:hypothetical protein